MRRLLWPVALLAALVWLCIVPLAEIMRDLLDPLVELGRGLEERLIAPLRTHKHRLRGRAGEGER